MARVIPQLRTTDLAGTIAFYTGTLGFTLDFAYGGFYAGVRLDDSSVHLKQVDAPDPSIAYVADGGHLHLYLQVQNVALLASTLTEKGVSLVQDVCETEWNTREFVIVDDQGHTLYFGEPI